MPELSLLASAALSSQIIGRLEPTLEPMLRCPRCSKVHLHGDQETGRAVHKCARGCTNSRWWAMVLEEGLVEPQLRWAFESIEVAALLVETYHLPAELARVMYWQLPLTPNQHHVHFTQGRRTRPRELFHILGLLRGIR